MAGLALLTIWLLGYWFTGPIALSPWRVDFMSAANAGAKARGAATPAPAGFVDKPSLPVMTHLLLRVGRAESLDGPPVPAERVFLGLVALDAMAALGLAVALIGRRRENPAAVLLARCLMMFAFALAAFLVNAQAGVRGNLLVWPGWPRLVLDVAATLTFGLSVVGLNRFFSIYPVRLEDWQVLETVRLRQGPDAARGRRFNLLSVARLIPKLITGLLVTGTALSTLPHLLFTIRYPLETRADGAVMSWPERLDIFALLAGGASTLGAVITLMAFGWLLASSLTARLRAARLQCTEEERRRSDWLFAGGLAYALMVAMLSVGVLLGLLYLAWGDSGWIREYAGSLIVLFFPAGWAVILIALAGAVFLSRSFGPQVLLKRTVLVAVAGVLMSLLLATIQHAMAMKILQAATPEMQHRISTLIAGGIVAFSLGTFRHRMERGIDGFLSRFMPATVIAEGKRRQLTIMFSDLGGYTALSAADEPKALLLAGHLQKVAAAVARQTGGRVVKTIGDAVMWCFDTPTAAMQAAMLLRDEFRSAVEKEGLPALPVNSGIHHGSVVEVPGGDVYGAAVNLAARLQGAANDGVIIASIEAVTEVAGGFKLAPIGKLDLKNVPVPVACFQVTGA